MNCGEAFEQVYQFLDKETEAEKIREIEIHLKICRGCWDYYEFEKKLIERFKSSCQQETCSETLRPRITQLLQHY